MYSSSNFSPQQSSNPGHSLGHISDQSCIEAEKYDAALNFAAKKKSGRKLVSSYYGLLLLLFTGCRCRLCSVSQFWFVSIDFQYKQLQNFSQKWRKVGCWWRSSCSQGRTRQSTHTVDCVAHNFDLVSILLTGHIVSFWIFKYLKILKYRY